MTGRLGAVCSLIERADTVADVGCDHGLVAKYCIENGLCKRMIASDISELCLDKARAALGSFENVEYKCCDGIAFECDEAIIAGMGGLLMSEILTKASMLPKTLVLCPHRNPDSVRRTLTRLGYGIERDGICKERNKFYFVMRAKLGGNVQALDEEQYRFGVYYAEDCEALDEYLSNLYNTYMRAPTRNGEELDAVRTAVSVRMRHASKGEQYGRTTQNKISQADGISEEGHRIAQADHADQSRRGACGKE